MRRHASVYFFGLWANNLSICPLFPILVTLSLYMANFGETSLSYNYSVKNLVYFNHVSSQSSIGKCWQIKGFKSDFIF